MTFELHHHDARHISQLLEPDSVDLIITSPPYFALRSYRDECAECVGTGSLRRMMRETLGLPTDPTQIREAPCPACNGTGSAHYDGQLGSEPSPAEFVDALIACTRDWLTVLKPSGSLWVNLGDSYAGSGGYNNSAIGAGGRGPASYKKARYGNINPRAKSLHGLPWRYALRCIDELGLILRAEVIWSKVNGLPESVNDRVRRSHEYWFHFVKSPRYFAAVDEIREPHLGPLHAPGDRKVNLDRNDNDRVDRIFGDIELGKVPGSVWSIEYDQWEQMLSGPIRFCPRCGRDLTAGNGAAPRTRTATASNGSPDLASDALTESRTSSTSDRSPTVGSSTTSAATADVSDPITSNPSPSETTSCAATPQPHGTPPSLIATTVTSSTTPTPTFEHVGTANAACVCATAPASTVRGSVWPVASEPLQVPDHLGVDHFAAFPSEWPRRIILGWSPSGYCTVCDQPRRAVVERKFHGTYNDVEAAAQRERCAMTGGTAKVTLGQTDAIERTITGYSCACSPDINGWPTAPTRPAVVLDPFCGTGTVPAVAHHLGRHGIGTDLSHDYLRLAEWRCTNDLRLRDKVLDRSGIPNPDPPTIHGQLDLFAEGA